MTFEFGIQDWGLRPYKVYSNDYPGLTFTYFTAMSNLPSNAFIWETAKILNFIETIEVYELKVGTVS